MLYTSFALVAASIAGAARIPRDGAVPASLHARDGGDPPFQDIPSSAKADNTFSNGKPLLAAEPPFQTGLPIPDVYGPRRIDLPFNRLYHGSMKFFGNGQLNSPTRDTDQWTDQPGVIDSAKQSACGIPDNAFSISKVAIHPYFLKYAPLDRYCMQDVCVSFWNGKTGSESSDMMLKVTDVCSTDPNDPTHCEKPGDIKVDRTKVKIMEKLTNEPGELPGNEFAGGEAWWFFAKCWADGLIQPAYTDNWFATPALPNNLKWAQDTANEQYSANNLSYPLHDPPLPKYPNGGYVANYNDVISPPIPDWSPSDPDPEWCPVAGGKGWGNPTGKNCGGSQQVEPASGESSSSAATFTSKVASSFGTSPTSTSATLLTPTAETSTPEAVESSSSSTSEAQPQATLIHNSTSMSTGLHSSKAGESVVTDEDTDDDECEW